MPDALDIAPVEARGVDSAKRRQILEGARQVFLGHGFDGASMGEIAKAACVSKGTLYVYFDSKEALFEALIIEERRSLAEVLFQLDADGPDPRSVLRRLGLSFLQMMVRTEQPGFKRSSQQLCAPISAARQRPRPVFSSPRFCVAGH